MAQKEHLPESRITKIEDGLYLGDSKSSRERDTLQGNHITAVVSLSVGRWVHWSQPWYREIVPEANHLFVPCKDDMTHDLLPDLARICDFIDQRRVDKQASNILVHCDKGLSRSPTVLIAYLMRSHRWAVQEALAFVEKKRRIKPNENFQEQLRVWEAVGYDIWLEGRTPKPEYADYLATRAVRLKERGLTGDEAIEIKSL